VDARITPDDDATSIVILRPVCGPKDPFRGSCGLAMQALERHIKEEWRIHKELMKDASVDVKRLASKHWRDTKAMHQDFFKELKKAWSAKR